MALVAGTAVMLGSSFFSSAGGWRGPILLALALVFEGIALRTVYAHRMIYCNALYIQTDLLPRLGVLYGTDPTTLYGWEEALGRTYDCQLGSAGTAGEALLYGAPGLLLFGFGVAESIGASFWLALPGVVAGILICTNLVALVYVSLVIKSSYDLRRIKSAASAVVSDLPANGA